MGESQNGGDRIQGLTIEDAMRSLALLQHIFYPVVHDLRSNLSAAHQCVEGIEDYAVPMSEDKAEGFRDLLDIAKDALRRIEGVCRYLRPQGSFALTVSVQEVVAALKEHETRVEVLNPEQNESLRVLFPTPLLSSILYELAANAVRHGKATRVGLSWRRRGESAVIDVEDDGAGFAQLTGNAAQPKDFFERGKGALGFYEGILLASGGLIVVARSETMGGAKVSVHIPGVLSE